MALEGLLFWAWCWGCLELGASRFVASQLATVLGVLLLFVCVFLLHGLDLLGLFIGSVYSSVFLAVALIALQFGPFWAPAQQAEQAPAAWRLGLGVLGGLLLTVVGTIDRGWGVPSWEGWLLWQELAMVGGASWASQSGLLHWFFFRCYVVETVGLNLYLFLGLLGVLLFLTARWSLRVIGTELGGVDPKATPTRIRLIARFRRQTRRANTTQLRHRA